MPEETAVEVSIDYEKLGELFSEHFGRSEQDIIDLINEHAPAGEGGLNEAQVIALINEHAGSGEGLGEEEVIDLINEHGGSGGGLTEDDVLELINENSADGLARTEVIELINEYGGLSAAEVQELIDGHEHEFDGMTEAEVLGILADNGYVTESEIITLIQDEVEAGSGGLTEDQVIALIEAHSGSGGGLSEEQVRAIVQDEMPSQATIDRLNEILDQLEDHIDEIGEELSITVGPESPSGEYHSVSQWGIHFETEDPVRFSTTTVDAAESGSFQAVLARYDGEDLFEPVDTTEVTVTQGVNENIELDLVAPTPGEYLLTREGTFALRRAEYQSSGDTGPLTIHGGSKPGDWDKPNNFWYYFFNLKVRAAPGNLPTHIIGPSEPSPSDPKHSTPGWGVHFEADSEFSVGDAKVMANRPGVFYAELHEYSGGDVQGLVDSTRISVPNDDIHTVDLDLSAPAGEYLLCRDYNAFYNEGFSIDQDGVSLARRVDYDGYDEDSGRGLEVYGSGHTDHNDTTNWFNFFDLHLRLEPED